MSNGLSRREFLKVAATVPFSLLPLSRWDHVLKELTIEDKPHIILIVYDTLSALHCSLYGYPRKTTPNLERFARRALVYHAHYSTANFTTPGVASMLTGEYPWRHGAIHQAGFIKDNRTRTNLFEYLNNAYATAAYSQNVWADIILRQFFGKIDQHLRPGEFSLFCNTFYDQLFSRDGVVGFKSWDQFLFNILDRPGSLFLSKLQREWISREHEGVVLRYQDEYPRGVPNLVAYPLYYLLEPVTDGVISMLDNLSSPSFAYIQFFSPHEPYFPRKEFIGQFDDGWSPDEKPEHVLSESFPAEALNKLRMEYDEYVAHTDSEIGRLIDHLEQTGLLDKSYVIITSDHGQLFERGVHGHVNPHLYEPLIRVPLLISKPRQMERQDIYAKTSSIDLFPTLLHLAGAKIPHDRPGQILPGLGGPAENERLIFSFEGKSTPVSRPGQKATIALVNDRYKLIHYAGYAGYDGVSELYDLVNDPQEMEDLSKDRHQTARDMRQIILDTMTGGRDP